MVDRSGERPGRRREWFSSCGRPPRSWCGHLRQVVRRNAAELLTRDATQRLLDQLRQTSPAVVEEIAPDKRSLGRVQQILQGLLSEGVSIRNLPTILETVCDGLVDTQDVEQLIDVVRRRTVGTTLANHRDASGHLNVITLAPEWEQQFTPEPPADSLAGEREPLGAEVLTSEERSEFCRQVRATIQPLLLANQPPILLVSSALRSRVRRTTQLAVPDLNRPQLQRNPPGPPGAIDRNRGTGHQPQPLTLKLDASDMEVKSYRAPTLQDALRLVQQDLGPDAAVLQTKQVWDGIWRGLLGRRQIEVTASNTVHVPSRFDGGAPSRGYEAASLPVGRPRDFLPHHPPRPPRRLSGEISS